MTYWYLKLTSDIDEKTQPGYLVNSKLTNPDTWDLTWEVVENCKFGVMLHATNKKLSEITLLGKHITI